MSNDIAIYDQDGTVYNVKSYCTVDLSNYEGQKAVFNALNDAEPLASHMGEVLSVKDVMLKPGTRRDRSTGVYVETINTYLFLVDGRALFSQSTGVLNAVVSLLTMHGDGFGDMPGGCVNLKCVEKQLANGNTLKTLVMA